MELMGELAEKLSVELQIIFSHERGAPIIDKRSSPQLSLRVATVEGQLSACDHMLVYLNDLTWTKGDQSAHFADEVKHAMDAGVHLLLAHEMLGMGQSQRHPCQFDNFYKCHRGATPQELLLRKIYDEIAIPLRGGPWRETSMVMLANRLVAATAGVSASSFRSDEPANAENSGMSRMKQLQSKFLVSIRGSVTSASVEGDERADVAQQSATRSALTEQIHLAVSARFGPGPLGMEFAQTDDVVRVTSVEQGSQASEQGVGTGDILLEVAGSQVTGLRKDEVIEAIKQAQRPFTVLFAPARRAECATTTQPSATEGNVDMERAI